MPLSTLTGSDRVSIGKLYVGCLETGALFCWGLCEGSYKPARLLSLTFSVQTEGEVYYTIADEK